MSRAKSMLTVVFAALVLLAVPHKAISGPTLVFEVESGTVLHSDDAGKPWYPASLTKLMTSYVVFHAMKNGQLKLDSKISYSLNAQVEPASKIGLPVDTKFSVDWALQALLVRSANDIAVALAEAVGGSEANFVRMMNEHAQRLAMTGSYFSNPHGLPDRRNITTARDMGLLARAIIREFPQYQKFFDAPNVKHGRRRLKNRNTSFLNSSKFSDGMKTGFICNSGFNVVASQTRDGRRLVAVVLGAKNGGVRTQTANTLMVEGFTKKAGGLLQRSRKLIELTNGGLFSRYPTDMAKHVCRRMGKVRITSPQTVRGWSVVLRRESKAMKAQDFLDKNLSPLKTVVYGGRAGVVRTPDKGGYAAMIYRLDAEQSRQLCAHLKAKGQDCEIVHPDTYKQILVRLEEEAKAKKLAKKKARQKKRALKQPATKKRKKAKKRRQVKAKPAVRRNKQKRTTTTSTPSPTPSPAPQGSLSLR